MLPFYLTTPALGSVCLGVITPLDARSLETQILKLTQAAKPILSHTRVEGLYELPEVAPMIPALTFSELTPPNHSFYLDQEVKLIVRKDSTSAQWT